MAFRLRMPSSADNPSPLALQWRRALLLLRRTDWRRVWRHNRGRKLLALFLAFFLWATINASERDAERTLELPVRLRSLPPELIVTNQPTKPVSVTVKGPRTILDGVDEHKLRIALDLASTMGGDTRFELNAEMLKPELPRRLKLVRIAPARLKLHIERVVRRTLPVKPDLAGMPAFGYSVVESQVSPDHVEVSGPASKISELAEVQTEPIELRGLSTVTRREVSLAQAADAVSYSTDRVVVILAIEAVIVPREFAKVPVTVLNADANAVRVSPLTVDLTLRGPQALLHNFKLEDGAVTIDAQGQGPGAHSMSVVVNLPEGLEVVRRQPERVTLEIKEAKGR